MKKKRGGGGEINDIPIYSIKTLQSNQLTNIIHKTGLVIMVCVSKKGEWKKRKEKKEIDKAQQNREGRLNSHHPVFWRLVMVTPGLTEFTLIA
jgi:hypothetical protein